MSSPADYSFLLQTIEGDIVKSLKDGNNNNNSRKRLKTNNDDVINNINDTPLSNVLYRSTSNNTDILNYSPDINILNSLSKQQRYNNNNSNNSIISIRESVENDELNILIEKLQDQLKNTQNEMERLKERNERQLLFLETENNQLKKLSEEKSEKYYDEKKKWQSKLRALEAENITLKGNEKKVIINNTNATISSSSTTTTVSYTHLTLPTNREV